MRPIALTVANDNPLQAWKEVVQNFTSGAPCFVETDLKNIDIDSELFKLLSDKYAWHFRDSHRSLLIKMGRNLTPYEFSYYDRIHSFFGFDQWEMAMKKPNNIICNWDHGDHERRPKPCFVTAKLLAEGKFVHLSVTFRTRDVLKRMYPNFLALRIFMQETAERMNKRVGKLFDYSNQIIADSDDIQAIKKWPEFEEY